MNCSRRMNPVNLLRLRLWNHLFWQILRHPSPLLLHRFVGVGLKLALWLVLRMMYEHLMAGLLSLSRYEPKFR